MDVIVQGIHLTESNILETLQSVKERLQLIEKKSLNGNQPLPVSGVLHVVCLCVFAV